MRRKILMFAVSALMTLGTASAAFAANAAPGGSDFVGGGHGHQTTSECAPASVPGCGR